MEVVMMEYTIASFIPVIIAAVTSTFLTLAVLGNQPAFLVPEVTDTTLSELPFIVVILGMTATMAAVLQAPLAALMAILEMTAEPAIIRC